MVISHLIFGAVPPLSQPSRVYSSFDRQETGCDVTFSWSGEVLYICTLRCSLSQGCRNFKPLPHVSNPLSACWYGQLRGSRCNRIRLWCACFSSSALQLRKPAEPSFLSGDGQAVAHRRRSLYVSFLERSGLYLSQYNLRLNPRSQLGILHYP